MRLCIRPFRPADQVPVRRLILAGLAERWGRLDPAKNQDLQDVAGSYAAGVFLVALLGDEVVGTGALVPEAAGVGRIVRMSVARRLRRQGVGRQLLQALLVEARARGYRRLVLETTATWEDAVAFYRRQGFRPVGERSGDLHLELELEEGHDGVEAL